VNLCQLGVRHNARAACFRETFDETRPELWVGLNGKGLLPIDEGRVGAVVIAGADDGVCGQAGHLVLVPSVQRHLFPVPVVGLPPNSPAAREFFDRAA